ALHRIAGDDRDELGIAPRVAERGQHRHLGDVAAADHRVADEPFRHQARSRSAPSPSWRAQCAQQYILPFASTPWPRMRQLQCAQTGASFWMAHSKLSNVCAALPATLTEKALS